MTDKIIRPRITVERSPDKVIRYEDYIAEKKAKTSAILAADREREKQRRIAEAEAAGRSDVVEVLTGGQKVMPAEDVTNLKVESEDVSKLKVEPAEKPDDKPVLMRGSRSAARYDAGRSMGKQHIPGLKLLARRFREVGDFDKADEVEAWLAKLHQWNAEYKLAPRA